MSIFFEILVSIASYGPQIDQSYGENRLNHIINTSFDFVLQHFKLCLFVNEGDEKSNS